MKSRDSTPFLRACLLPAGSTVLHAHAQIPFCSPALTFWYLHSRIKTLKTTSTRKFDNLALVVIWLYDKPAEQSTGRKPARKGSARVEMKPKRGSNHVISPSRTLLALMLHMAHGWIY